MKRYNIFFISTILLYSVDAIKLPLTGVEIIQNSKKSYYPKRGRC